MTQITKEGLEILQSELKDLIENKKPQAIDRLQKARNMGDLSENSEYTSAKDGLAMIEDRIHTIEATIKTAEIVEDNHNNNEISLGSHIKVQANGEQNEFHIVGEYEADPSTNKLSMTSPIGQALLGKKTGDLVEIEVPAGKTQYKILEIK
ncbi:MAG: transcription elongation factor GreA [Patescibacteria group bacterium]